VSGIEQYSGISPAKVRAGSGKREAGSEIGKQGAAGLATTQVR
jgi:hypothetical protein